MTILIVLAVLVVAGFFLDGDSFGPFLLIGMLSGIVLIVALISLPLNRMTVAANLARFNSVATTAETARAAGDGIEAAAFRMQIAEQNAWLAEQQYVNGTLFDIWIPDIVDSTEPIQ